MSYAYWAVGGSASSTYQTLSLSGDVLSLVPLGGSVVLPSTATGVASITAGTGIALSGSPTNPTVSNTGVLNVVQGSGVSITGSAASPIISANIPTGATSGTRWVQSDFGGMPLQLLPGNVVFSLNDGTCPGLLGLLRNTLYNMIEVYAQFGIETVAAQPKLNLGFLLQPDGGAGTITPYVCGNVNLGNAGTGSANPPGEFPYTLRAFLIRNVHYAPDTTSFAVYITPSSNPSPSLITLLQSGDGSPSANVRFTFIGSV